MMNTLRNVMRLEAERAASRIALVRMGIVTGYDPDHYAAKVTLQPEGHPTGWLPITTPWVGNGWGWYAPPSIGDVVEVHFQEGDRESGFIVNRFFSAKTKPLSVPSGEAWLVHGSGSFIKLTNDGKATVKDKAGSTVVLNGDGTGALTFAGGLTINANVAVNGTVTATGDITDHSSTTNESVATMRSRYNAHVHPGVQTGGGNTGTTTQTM